MKIEIGISIVYVCTHTFITDMRAHIYTYTIHTHMHIYTYNIYIPYIHVTHTNIHHTHIYQTHAMHIRTYIGTLISHTYSAPDSLQ